MHIADVTHFLKPDTAMDAEAALRGTTVYLVQVGGRGTTGHYGEPGGGGGALYSVVRTEYRVLPLRLTPGAVAASRSYHFCHTVPPVTIITLITLLTLRSAAWTCSPSRSPRTSAR